MHSKIRLRDNNFTGPLTAHALAANAQPSFEHPGYIGSSTPITTGVKMLPIVVCGKTIQLGSDSKSYLIKLQADIGSLFFDSHKPLLHIFFGMLLLRGKHLYRQFDGFPLEC